MDIARRDERTPTTRKSLLSNLSSAYNPISFSFPRPSRNGQPLDDDKATDKTKECVLQVKILLVQFSTLQFHFTVRTEEGVASATSVRFFPHDNGKKKRAQGTKREEECKSLVLEVLKITKVRS